VEIHRWAIRPMKILTSIFSVGVVVVALYAVNLWLRLADPQVMAVALAVSGAGMLAATNWLDGARARMRGSR
jgi:phosphatidylglycerophosphate synthase